VFNIRQDDFGGTPEKMARFALDVVIYCQSRPN
jgi:2,4-dienoyl-CoA reductase-like NADH-dependent reductase (Old Yellow Enzyme family)